jgi:hypothetical protein
MEISSGIMVCVITRLFVKLNLLVVADERIHCRTK